MSSITDLLVFFSNNIFTTLFFLSVDNDTGSPHHINQMPRVLHMLILFLFDGFVINVSTVTEIR